MTAAARAEVTRVSLLPKAQAQQQPMPGQVPDRASRYALVEYRLIEANVQSAIPFDDWENAPTIGQIIEVSISIIPTLEPRIGHRPDGAIPMPPAPPPFVRDSS